MQTLHSYNVNIVSYIVNIVLYDVIELLIMLYVSA